MILTQALPAPVNVPVRAITIDPAALLDTKAAARLLSFSEIYLKVLRCNGTGPKFIRFGRAIRYRHIDIMVWLAEHAIETRRCAATANKHSAAANDCLPKTNKPASCANG